MQSPHCTVSKFLPAQLSRNCRLTNNLLDKITSTPLSSVYPTDQLPQVFSDFFVNKVQQVHDSIYRQVVHFPFTQSYRAAFLQYTLCGFETVTQETVLKCMKQMSPKTCVLHPIPASLLFQCSDQVVPLLTTIVNQSLSTGIFPSCMKSAVVKPLLKKNPHLTQMCLKTSGLFQICPACPNSLRNVFLTNFSVSSTATIFGTHSNQLIAQNTVPRQLSVVSKMTS